MNRNSFLFVKLVKAALMRVPFALVKAALILSVFATGIAILGASIGPNVVSGTLPVQQQSGGVQGSGSFTLSSSASVYLSSGGTAATSVPCNWVELEAQTQALTVLVGSNTGGMTLPTGLQPLTISCSNLNTLKVSGSGGTASYVYGL